LSLLPDESLLPTILELEGELADIQAKVEALNLSLNTMVPASAAYVETSGNAKLMQDELNSIYNKLDKNRNEYETKLTEAQIYLFELTNVNEPSLGSWQFASREEYQFENKVNLGTPFGDPWFDRVLYKTYPGELTAVRALQNDMVDIILLPEGLSPDNLSYLENDPEIHLNRNVTRSARFLAFNHANPYLADPVLHQALACMLDPGALVESLEGDAASLPGFVLDEFWQNEAVSLPCSGAGREARLAEAVRLLKDAGYSWVHEPAVDVEGVGLKRPGEFEIPTLTLLAPAEDKLRGVAAQYIAQQAKILGLSIDVKMRNFDDLLYAVYGSRDYDMALLGWRLSTYPSYLCEWFQPWEQNPFVYSGDGLALSEGEGLKSVCEAWSQSSELEMAKLHAFEAQTILMHDLPLIPLYSGVRFDAYRNIHYPFTEVIDGLGGLYGALELAIPIP
jgi:ABC-type transport system substrate-binding protein